MLPTLQFHRGWLRTLAMAIFVASPLIAQANTHVVFGTPGRLSDNSLAVKVAIDKGFYRDAGLDVEVVDFKGGAPAVQALVGGGIQFAIIAPEHVVRLRNRHLDGEVALALQDHQSYALLAAQSSPVNRFSDLKGRRVGITSPGSLTENLIRLAAKKAGFDVANDLEIVSAGLAPTQKAAIDSRGIDAGMFANVDAIQLLTKGYKIVYDWRQEKEPALALVTLGSWVKANPDAAHAVIAATYKAQQLILSDPAVAEQALASLYPTLPAATVAQVAAGLRSQLSATPDFSRTAFETLEDDVIQSEPALHRIDFDNFQMKPSGQ
jgi:NitT/TauT family transport system substrate-binding protein